MDIVSWTLTSETAETSKPLLIDAANPSRFLTFNGVRKVVRQLVSGLKARGIQPGDCVCVASFNDIHYTPLYLGVIGAGARFTGVNPSYTAPELTHHVQLTGAKMLIVEPAMLNTALETARNCGIPASSVFVFDVQDQNPNQDIQSWEELLTDGEKDWVRVNNPSSTVASYCTTSGTSGLPKAAMISHSYLVSQAALRRSPYLSYEPIILLCLPQFHVFASPIAPASVRQGHPTYVMRRYHPSHFIKCIVNFQITETYMAPPVLIGLPQSPLCTKDAMRSIRQIWMGGAGVKYVNMLPMYERLAPEARIMQVWGMTEVGWVTTFPFPELSRDDSVGRVLDGFKVQIIDDSDNIIGADNEAGELLIRAPAPMLGYLGNEKATAETLDRHGWVRSGDIGYRSQGKIYVVDRKKDLIKVRGWQVSPAEVESAILAHPDVLDAGVISVNLPDGSGEVPKAYVVCKPESSLTEVDIKNFARKSLASYKMPEQVVFRNTIPRNPTGKILRRVLRDENVKGSGEKVVKAKIESLRMSEPAMKGGLLVVWWRMVLADVRLRALFCWLRACCGM
ncbi:amp dependent CoA ligase [Glonium stellatum]|uniref:Amp dependent CoA ligase n=1 Tax=Glonium stellatum TaxID=574774 RepID=A0A8E2EVP6_9PEZI|nr:amp dependent CoA ligase [Glonium stellatum]